MNIFSSIAHILVSVVLSIGVIFGVHVNAPQNSTSQTPSAHTNDISSDNVGASAKQNPVAPSQTASEGSAQGSSASAGVDLNSLTGTSVDLTKLPLGDNKYTTTGAKKGYVYICHVMSGGQGAMVNGPWIHGTTWDATAKIAVMGSVAWPSASIKVSVSGSTRTIIANDEPTNHNTGSFPISASDPAAQYDRNQSSITAQNNIFNIPASPTIASSAGCIYGMVGVMTNGVTLNDAFDALYRDAPAHEEQDSCAGHPNNEEGYHYHNLSGCFKDTSVSTVIGWAFDGFPITGNALPNGSKLSSADLDECHGMTSAVTVDGKSTTTYHYVMTSDFPYSVGCFKGKSYEPNPVNGQTSPGSSSSSSGSGGSTSGASTGGSSSTQGGPPQQAIDACSGKSSNASCSISTPNGTLTGTCKTPPNTSSLACVPN